MTESYFNRLAAEGYNRNPVTLETFADLDTPLSIYLKLANGPYTYLLESVQGGERFGRYSFIGLASQTRIVVNAHQVLVLTGNRIAEREDDTNPLEFIGNYMKRFRAAPSTGLPRFCGGLVGCFGYDTVRYVETKLTKTRKEGKIADDIGTPDIVLLLSEEIAVVDNLTGKLTLVVYAEPGVPGAYQKAQARLKELLAKLRAPANIPSETPRPSQPAVSMFGEAHFKQAVLKAKHYITEGDLMQVVLSQRMSKPFAASPLALYRSLRSLNPSPYMFYFNLEDFHVVGASPEILVRLEGDTVTVRPIAGTRKRGSSFDEDQALAAELLADEKERAEHVQLLDLGRNDAGRVAQTGSVKLTENMTIERYSHVMHIVSNVEAKLQPGLNALDVLKATFPAGTVSGAPKVRAMEIIDELEPTKRGIYAGAVGYLGFHGDMDLAIAIRTAVVKDGKLHVQAGAGIVADSDPSSEWQETQNKARAVLRAAEWPSKASIHGLNEEANMLLMIDNYDSFTYNIVQYFGELGQDVKVFRNDAITLGEIARLNPEYLVISPGPAAPAQAGISLSAIREFAGKIPLLGVCLGHQSIGEAFGGKVVHAKKLMHGKVSPVHHSDVGVFRGLPNPITCTRYHSLAVERESLPIASRSRHGPTTAKLWGCATRRWRSKAFSFTPNRS